MSVWCFVLLPRWLQWVCFFFNYKKRRKKGSSSDECSIHSLSLLLCSSGLTSCPVVKFYWCYRCLAPLQCFCLFWASGLLPGTINLCCFWWDKHTSSFCLRGLLAKLKPTVAQWLTHRDRAGHSWPFIIISSSVFCFDIRGVCGCDGCCCTTGSSSSSGNWLVCLWCPLEAVVSTAVQNCVFLYSVKNF